MMDWLIDTFIWTGALIALVLVIRRPVATIFGPKLAYALWLLPLLRLLLPPVTLPSWMAPTSESVPTAEAVTVTVNMEALSPIAAQAAAAPEALAAPWVTVSDILLPLWIGGAIAFLVWRWVDYRRMKDELLADALPVGERGAVRLVESVVVNSPIAFGVRDKVIALPPGFISSHDTHARDLAIEHELQHHEGRDLLANFAAQAVLALHWFNPLAWAGWRAMRRDQEAACDARVIEQRGREERAAYGQVIAGFAAGPHLALAAPMACPVLGEKSVIHRLRSLNMSDVSTRRRLVGRAALLAGALALPMTASISYAEDIQDSSADTPQRIEVIETEASAFAQADDKQAHSTVVSTDDEDVEVIVIKDGDGETAEKVRTIVKKLKKGDNADEDAKTFVWVEETEGEDGKKTVKKIKKSHSVFVSGDKHFSEEDRKELREALKEIEGEWDSDVDFKNEIKIAMAEAKGEVTRVSMRCDGKGSGSVHSDAEVQKVFICKSEIMASALTGMKAAREQIANELDIPEEARKEALRSLDAEISRLEEKS